MIAAHRRAAALVAATPKLERTVTKVEASTEPPAPPRTVETPEDARPTRRR